MNFNKTILPGIIEIVPKVHKDNRGYLIENFQKDEFKKNGIPVDFDYSYVFNLNSSTKPIKINNGADVVIRCIEGKIKLSIYDQKKSLTIDLDSNEHIQYYIPEEYSFIIEELCDSSIVEICSSASIQIP